MTHQLPPFNLSSICPKCGLVGGGPGHPIPPVGSRRPIPPPPPDPFPTDYHSGSKLCDCRGAGLIEHLCRICPRCGFSWAEACVEVPPP